MLHGWSTSGNVWRDVIEGLALDNEEKLYNPTLPCHGGDFDCGDKWNSSGSGGAVCPGVETVLKEIPEGEEVIGVGWSLGAQTLMKTEMARPGRFKKLLLIGATPCFVKREDFPHGQPRSVVKLMLKGLRERPKETLERLALLNFTDAELQTAPVRNYLERCSKITADRVNFAGIATALEAISTVDIREGLGSIQIPVLLLHGTHDTVTPVGAAHYLHEQLPNARLHLIDGAGHAPFITAKESFIQLLDDFANE